MRQSIESAWLAVFISASTITILTASPISNFDIWWQLHSGLWALDHGRALDREIWSFTQPEDSWTNFNWGFQTLAALVYRAAGDWGLFGLKSALLFLLFTFTAGLSVHKLGNLPAFFFSASVLIEPISRHLMLRPFLLEGIFLLALVALCNEPLTRRRYIISVGILLLWANCHASAIVGAAAFGLFVLVDRWRAGRFRQDPREFLLLLPPAIVPFLTPSGWDVLTVLTSHESSTVAPLYIAEWLPHEKYPWVLLFGVGVYFASLVTRRQSIQVAETALILFFTYFSFRSSRFEYELGLLLFRPLTAALSEFLDRLQPAGKSAPTLFVLLLLAIYLHGRNPFQLEAQLIKHPVNYDLLPVSTTQVLNYLAEQESKRPLHVFNLYKFGGYLPFATHGRVRHFIDGRTPTIFKDSIFLAGNAVHQGNRTVLMRLQRQYGIDALLLGRGSSRLVYSASDPDWQLVAFDQASLLYVSRPLAKKHRLPDIGFNPNRLPLRLSPDVRKIAIKSLTKLVLLTPHNSQALLHLGVAQGYGDQDLSGDSIRHLHRALALEPGSPHISMHLAWRMLNTGSSEQDVRAILATIDLDQLGQTSAPTLLDLAKIAIDVREPEFAKLLLYPNTADSLRRLNGLFDAWIARGLVHAALNELVEADYALAIAQQMVDDNNEPQSKLLEYLQKRMSALYLSPPAN
jgi:hypothetical protein